MKGPGERGWVTLGIFAFAAAMLMMARENPKLWDVKLFEIILQAVVLTGLLNMVAAFHFGSNKGSETARENTGKAFSAIEAAARAGNEQPEAEVADAADDVAEAAADKADEIKASGGGGA